MNVPCSYQKIIQDRVSSWARAVSGHLVGAVLKQVEAVDWSYLRVWHGEGGTGSGGQPKKIFLKMFGSCTC